MGWSIKCRDKDCGEETWARNIVELIEDHCDDMGWIRCAACNNAGYIKKSFDLQEPGEVWEPHLRGVIRLSDEPNDTYQPFVFLVSGTPNEQPSAVWFSYYKDTRTLAGGRLKLGYGPGGPPVLEASKVVELVDKLEERGLIERAPR